MNRSICKFIHAAFLFDKGPRCLLSAVNSPTHKSLYHAVGRIGFMLTLQFKFTAY
jgi:hypothetical protein